MNLRAVIHDDKRLTPYYVTNEHVRQLYTRAHLSHLAGGLSAILVQQRTTNRPHAGQSLVRQETIHSDFPIH